MYHSIYNFDEKRYNFNDYLKQYYSKKYGPKDFSEYHQFLDDVLSRDEFYKTRVPIFGKTDRASPFIKDFYELFDNDYTFLYKYLNFIKDNIQPHFDYEPLVVQRTPNIRFHLHGYSNIGRRDTDMYEDIIGVHRDGEFGHPEDEINVVLPITSMYDTNSIFYEPEPDSGLDYDDYCNMKLETNQFYMGNLNRCNHYNRINVSGSTRVSFDFRVIPYSKYRETNTSSATSNKRFKLGDYYMLLY